MISEEYKQFNCYKCLGIHSNATLQEIRTAYKKASLLNHPDKGGTHEAMVNVNLAYKILSNPIERQVHDMYWNVKFDKYSNTTSSGFTDSDEGKNRSAKQNFSKAKQINLDKFQKRIYDEIRKEKQRIEDDLKGLISRITDEMNQEFRNRYKKNLAYFFIFILVAVGAYFTQYELLEFARYPCGLLAIEAILGFDVLGKRFFLMNFNLENKIKAHAEKRAEEDSKNKIAGLERHIAALALLADLLKRDSSFDDSEEQIVRRIAAAFFLMGYTPLEYDSKNRVLVISDGEEKLLVRFRHRSGTATNIVYVRSLVFMMMTHRSSKGFLFCSPGLSGNAAEYAKNENIKWYSLETMNEWITEVLDHGYTGPQHGLFDGLDKLIYLIRGVATRLGR